MLVPPDEVSDEDVCKAMEKKLGLDRPMRPAYASVAVGPVGRGHRHGQQMTRHIDRLVARRATAVCGPINLHAFGGPDSPVDEKCGDATGIGDIVLRAKYHLYKGPVADITGALLLKLPKSCHVRAFWRR